MYILAHNGCYDWFSKHHNQYDSPTLIFTSTCINNFEYFINFYLINVLTSALQLWKIELTSSDELFFICKSQLLIPILALWQWWEGGVMSCVHVCFYKLSTLFMDTLRHLMGHSVFLVLECNSCFRRLKHLVWGGFILISQHCCVHGLLRNLWPDTQKNLNP